MIHLPVDRFQSEGKLTGSWADRPPGSTPQSAAKLSKNESLKVSTMSSPFQCVFDNN